MSIFIGWGSRVRGLFANSKGPWGSGEGGGEEPPPDDGAGAGPWGEPPRRGRRTPINPAGNVSSLDDWLRRSRMRFGGDGGLPGRPDRSLVIWAAIGFVCVWLIFTSFHSISPGERGVVSRFGRYSWTLGPGVSLTLPSPIDRVKKIDVENIRSIDLGSADEDDLMLTGDLLSAEEARRYFEQAVDQMESFSQYALTGAVIAQDRAAIAWTMERLRFAAGNFYINDKPTGAVVGQQPFGGAGASGTNDKAGAAQNLMRWSSPRSIKETFAPPKDYRYPHMG